MDWLRSIDKCAFQRTQRTTENCAFELYLILHAVVFRFLLEDRLTNDMLHLRKIKKIIVAILW